jgi:peptidyl-prolyl cis-trans isomerase C
MKLNHLVFVSFIAAALPYSVAQTQTSASGAIVTVNGTKILQKEVDGIVKNAVARGAKDGPELRQAIVNDLILKEAILQDVKKSGVDKKGDNPEKIKLAQQQFLQELWFEDYLKAHPINESDIKADYDRQANLTKEGRNSNEYKVSQIVVATEADANSLITQINGGDSFEKLAKEKSLEKVSGAQGGSISNWVLPDMVVAPLGDALVNLTKGKIDPKPVKTNIGWHVVRVDEVRKFKMPSFDEAKGNIYQGLLARKKQEAIDALIKKTTIAKAN